MIDRLKNPFFLKIFLLQKLPLAFFAGLRLESIDDMVCITSMPYKWITKNPFKSMYFAAQSMAAEFSTASLAVIHIDHSKANIAMIIVGLEAEFLKKAKSRIHFRCADGNLFREAIEFCKENPEGKEVTGLSEGVDSEGNVVSRFKITWSFKLRN